MKNKNQASGYDPQFCIFASNEFVMITNEFKNILIRRIAGINDKSFLSSINTLIETKSGSSIYQTTAEQCFKILEGRNQITNGESFTNEQVEIEIDQWFKD
jgi:hypothetical protein